MKALGSVVSRVVSGVGSGAGSIFGANEQVKGYKGARTYLDQAKQAYNPFVDAGLEGFDQFQQAIMGTNNQGFETFMQRPDIQYQIQEGLSTATQGLAGRGMLNSGRGRQELQQVGQQAAGQGFQQYLGNLGALANYGLGGLDAQSGLSRDLADVRIGLGGARAQRSQAIGDVAGGDYS